MRNYAQIVGSKIDAADTVFEIRLGELRLEKPFILGWTILHKGVLSSQKRYWVELLEVVG
ncbi:hypothetical protein EU537_05905 [Candidatus Thorarchaeota archaeon]|nr:MAG: hypothetical protein EU537_05905 [Candidatus Thorarchaeota archaeon]